MTQAAKIIQLKEQGLRNKEIATTLGCSYGNVSTVLWRAKMSGPKARPITTDDCVYVNLRRWMNDNKICKRKLNWLVFGTYENAHYIVRLMRGEVDPRKKNN